MSLKPLIMNYIHSTSFSSADSKKLHFSDLYDNFAFYFCSVHCLPKQMMLPLCQQLPELLFITRNNDKEEGIPFPWQTSVIYRTKHCCRKFSQNKFSICLNNKGPTKQLCTPWGSETDGCIMDFHLSAWHRVFTRAAFKHMVAICKDISY